MSRVSVWNLEPSTYARHALHGEANQWVEKNCYIDVWIEALHAAGLEPLALMPFTIASDFDGDQWTFYKPPHTEIQELYGVSVQELNVYKPILEHSLYHAARGRLVFTEADAYFMPDTQGTDYPRITPRARSRSRASTSTGASSVISTTRATTSCPVTISSTCFASGRNRIRRSCRCLPSSPSSTGSRSSHAPSSRRGRDG